MNIKRIKDGLDIFVYILFVIVLYGMIHSIYTRDFISIISSGFGVFVFGMCIYLSRLLNRRIRELEKDQDNE